LGFNIYQKSVKHIIRLLRTCVFKRSWVVLLRGFIARLINLKTVFMSVFKSVVPVEEFDPFKDKIAVMLRSFKIKKKVGMGDRKYSEPYFITIAIPQNKALAFQNVEFTTRHFPKIRRGAKTPFLGYGMQIYGPANPGEFLAFSVLVMESDQDVRKAGESLRAALDSDFAQTAFSTLGTINPSVAIATKLAEQLARLIAERMKKNEDDEVFLTSGALLRDVMDAENKAFHIQEMMFPSNDYVDLEIEVLPVAGTVKAKKRISTLNF
jgi:hypothetical protein